MTIPVITIDGPSGAGKGTICQRVAEHTGWHLLDSGALYRLTAYGAIKHDIATDNETALAELAAKLDVQFLTTADGLTIQFEQEDVSQKIRNEDVAAVASKVAAIPAVREALLQRQRDFQQAPGLIADGRDMGTSVFPDAPVKIFLTASAQERARRRYKQLTDKGDQVDFDKIHADIVKRDEQDSNRKTSPLKPADDAVILDTTELSIDEVVEQVIRSLDDISV